MMPMTDIATFNVNSVKSRLPILDVWLSSENAPDILCLQETKCRDEDFPAAFFEDKGYHCVFKGMKSYNGVAVVSRAEPDEFEFGLCDEGEEGREESENARVARVRFGGLTVLNTYIPQGKEIDNPDYLYKLRFIGRVKRLLERKCSSSDRVVWLGDLNVAPTDLLHTVTRFTAETIAYGLRRFSPQMPQRLIVGGGGSMNPVLLAHIADCLPGCQVLTNEQLGLDSSAKEAVAFAVLANEALYGCANNAPGATGAAHGVVMGKISL